MSAEPFRRVVVTGAGRGIGAAIARRFAADGDEVLLVDRDLPSLQRAQAELAALDGPVRTCAAELSTDDGVAAVVSEVRERWDGLDVLVNNAGIAHKQPFLEHPREAWDRVVAVNLTAPFALSQALVPFMVARGRGAVVHIASIDSFFADGDFVGYNAAKAGLLGLMRTMAVELAPHGIRSNAVLPGFTATDMVRRDASDADWESIHSRFPRAPLGRMVEPHEIASAVAFLASADASAITGASLIVDGGVTANVYVAETLDRD
ncbi:MAG TPA: SDR family NAD(P)-dependent oxidoreductase [Baekduia sp.]|uniref:SDR family NAD(P)-dependent oxidoreductase n=1 Tax=Baekduia sp. TaxID=2600305 RepID=UPI002D77DBE4|nr:SDR family NAD(P)-dependent oxidoreductase [Baekduia sp.]HET6509122.1 SDR family NAD(P)-dependent oxidoreductase [Baekduia sp.]